MVLLGFLFWIAQICWFFIPVGIANMAPPTRWAREWLPLGARRIWFPAGRGLSEEAIQNLSEEDRMSGLGPNKTWRGVLAAVIAATSFCIFQWLLYFFIEEVRPLYLYGNLHPFIVGPLWGIGAMLGDSYESWYKRSEGIASGEDLKMWDSVDFVIGGCVLVGLAAFIGWIPARFTFIEFTAAFLLSWYFHPKVKKIGLWLKIARDGSNEPAVEDGDTTETADVVPIQQSVPRAADN